MLFQIAKLAVFGGVLLGVGILVIHLIPSLVGLLAVFGLYKLWQSMGGRPPSLPPSLGGGQ